MKQFWTPLARAFGFRLNTPVDVSAQYSQPPSTHFPLLEQALTNYARRHLLPAARLKAEIRPDGVLSLQSLVLTALSHAMNEELLLWRQQGTQIELLEWIRHGPFSAEDIQLLISCAELDQLSIHTNPVAPELAHKVSAYAFNSIGNVDLSRSLEIQSEWHWIARMELPPQPASSGTNRISESAVTTLTDSEADTATYELPLEIVDEQGTRRLRLRHTVALWVIGKPKQMLDPEGRPVQPIHAQPIDFKGEPAQYVATLGRHMSGMHVAVRQTDHQWQWLDLRSTNGSFDKRGRVNFDSNQWRNLMPLDPIYLGGPSTDDRRLSPSVTLLLDPPQSWISANATPLRPSPETQAFLVLNWAIITNDENQDIPISHLPFTLGRDTRCDGIISASHTMVSRRHLVIEAIDCVNEKWKIRDVSSQGLTECGTYSQAQMRIGAWLSLKDEVILGKTATIRGVKIRLSKT